MNGTAENQPSRRIRAAAVQLDAVIGDVDANLAAAERLAGQAAADGAEWIILPEFFTTGVAFLPELASTSLAPDGAAAELMAGLARRHGVTVGGSFLCRDVDGEVRNAFMLFDQNGRLLGRHDKDLPTMWENCFYIGGDDDGVFMSEQGSVGVAMCWELIRSQTARRLLGRVDLVVGGSCWWSVPAWPPRTVTAEMEQKNAVNATQAAPNFARLLGVPVIHAAHCGAIDCRLPWTPLAYHGRTEGGAAVTSASGELLAFRAAEDGEGVALAEVEIGAQAPTAEIPDAYWLCQRGPIPTLAWNYQRAHGRRFYRRHVRGR